MKWYPQLRKEEQTVKNNLKDIEKSVKEVIAELLDGSDDRTGARHSPYDLDASFLELGINSVLAVELVEALNQKLGIELGVEVMFDYKNMRELAQFIFKQYGAEGEVGDIGEASSPLQNGIMLGDLPTCSGELASPMPERRSSDIAIIGISGKFADAPNIEALWQHLQVGESCIKEIRRKGWETSAYYDPDPERINTSVSKWGGCYRISINLTRYFSTFHHLKPQGWIHNIAYSCKKRIVPLKMLAIRRNNCRIKRLAYL